MTGNSFYSLTHPMCTCRTECCAVFAKSKKIDLMLKWMPHVTPHPPSFLCRNSWHSFHTPNTSSTLTQSCQISENAVAHTLALTLQSLSGVSRKTVCSKDQKMSADTYLCKFFAPNEGYSLSNSFSFKLINIYILTDWVDLLFIRTRLRIPAAEVRPL